MVDLGTQLYVQRLAWFVVCCITKAFFKEYVYMRLGVQCFKCTRPTYDIYDKTKPQNTTTSVAPKLIRTCSASNGEGYTRGYSLCAFPKHVKEFDNDSKKSEARKKAIGMGQLFIQCVT